MKLNALEEAIQIQNGIMEQIVSKVGVVKLLEATLESRTQSLNAEIKMINDTQEIFDRKLTRNTRILTNTKPVNSKNFASQSCSTQTEAYKEGNSIISMESISRATQTTGLASIETGPQPQPLFVEPQTLTTKHVKSNTALSKIDPKNMKIQTRQPVNAKIPEQKSQTKVIEQPATGEYEV